MTPWRIATWTTLRSVDGQAVELTWTQLGIRLRAIGAHLQQVTARGDRVAILAPQGIDYVAGFFAAIKAGTIAVPLFAPELPGHAERLDTALRDVQPTAVLTTAAAAEAVGRFRSSSQPPKAASHRHRSDTRLAADAFAPTHIDVDDISHLQYTSGSTRPRSAWRSPIGRSAPICCR